MAVDDRQAGERSLEVAFFGDLFVRASLLEERLRYHFAPLVRELNVRSIELVFGRALRAVLRRFGSSSASLRLCWM